MGHSAPPVGQFMHEIKLLFLLPIDRDVQLWRFKRGDNGDETMTLENKFLSQMGKDWEFQNYEWIVPKNNDKGCMEAYKIETDCKLRKIESIVYYCNSTP